MGEHFRQRQVQVSVEDIPGIDLSSKHTRHNRKERRGFLGRSVALLGALATTIALHSGQTQSESPRIEFAASSTEICAATVPDGGGMVSSEYGENRGGYTHGGIDCPDEIGSPIKAAQSGVVIDAGPASGFGQWVRVQHEDGTVGVYGHMETITVSVGQRVNAGDVIATVGNRGESTGPHLHFEIDQPSGKMNPEDANLNLAPGAASQSPTTPNADPRASAPLTTGVEDLVRTLPGQQGFTLPPEVRAFEDGLTPNPVAAPMEVSAPMRAETIPAPISSVPTFEQLQQDITTGAQDFQAKIQQDFEAANAQFESILSTLPPLPTFQGAPQLPQ